MQLLTRLVLSVNLYVVYQVKPLVLLFLPCPFVVIPGVIAMSILFITFKLPVYMESQINSKEDERTKPAEAWYWYIGVPVEVCYSHWCCNLKSVYILVLLRPRFMYKFYSNKFSVNLDSFL